jgi:hypothetical protein
MRRDIAVSSRFHLQTSTPSQCDEKHQGEFKKALYAKVYEKSLSILLWKKGWGREVYGCRRVHITRSPPVPYDTKERNPLAGKNEKETTLFGMRWNPLKETAIYAFLRHANGERIAKRKEERKRKKLRTFVRRMLSFWNNKEQKNERNCRLKRRIGDSLTQIVSYLPRSAKVSEPGGNQNDAE